MEASSRVAVRRASARVGVVLLAAFLSILIASSPGRALAAPPQTFAGPGSGAGQVDSPKSIAVNRASGDVYLADRNNFRIDQFDAAGRFLRAWGFGVADGQTHAPQTCGPAATPPTAACFGAARDGLAAAGEVVPDAIAVDQDSGDLYVAEGFSRVSKFGPSGEFLLTFGKGVNRTPGTAHPDLCTAADLAAGGVCGEGEAGDAPGQLERPFSVAVGPDGDVYAGEEGRVLLYGSDGAYLSQLDLPGWGRIYALAVAANGDLYLRGQGIVAGEGFAGVRRLAAGSDEVLETIDAGGQPEALALDAAGNLYVGDGNPFAGNPYRFLVFDPAGNQVAQFGTGQVIGTLSGPHGNALAVNAGTLYAANSECCQGSAAQAFPLPAPGPLPELPRATALTPTGASLAASLNPEGDATTYHFEYGEDTSYEGGSTPPSSLAAGFADATVGADVTGLVPATEYHFRLVASNHCDPADPGRECVVAGEDVTFTTPPAVAIGAEWVSRVDPVEARFGADLDPLGAAATYWVEYGTDATYGATTPPRSLTAEAGPATASVPVAGLRPGTAYHYRFVASDERDGVAYRVEGEDRSFTTPPESAGFRLLDGRAWELVSPADKGAAVIDPRPFEAAVQASASGDAVSYLTIGSLGAGSVGNRSPEPAQVISRRGAAGWDTRDISTPSDSPSPYAVGAGHEYRFFAPDLAAALVEPHSGLPLSPEASERTPYLRREGAGGAVSYRPLVTGQEGFANVPPGTAFGGNVRREAFGAVRVQGASEDLGYAVVKSSVPLAEGAGLYEWHDGQLRGLSVLPAAEGGVMAGGGLGAPGANSRHAISADGRYVYWSSGGGSSSRLYLRDVVATRTIRVDAVQPGASGNGAAAPLFQGASADGTRAFFTDTQRLTADAGAAAGKPDLYECELVQGEDGVECRLTDLTPEREGQSAAVLGFLPALSEDGSRVYFVANGALAGAAEPGGCVPQAVKVASTATCNLYLATDRGGGWETTFVATLSNEDVSDWAASNSSISTATDLTAGSSPSGRYFAFLSNRGLTGYDDVDASGGGRDVEVYLYDAAAGKVRCASCNPTGARPTGTLASPRSLEPWAVDPLEVWAGRWLAAILPTQGRLSRAVGVQSARRPHFVLDNGRVFFNAIDALVPADSNGAFDVYAYEPSAAGGTCGAGDGAAVAAADGGCVGLVSSGSSPRESAFLDASDSGDDVFFLTAANLAGGDSDGNYDVYDAHVCGSGWACPQPPPLPTGPCASGEACRPGTGTGGGEAATPLPGSAGFAGAGNLRPRAAGKRHRRHSQRKARRHHRAKRHGAKHRRGRAGRRHGRARPHGAARHQRNRAAQRRDNRTGGRP